MHLNVKVACMYIYFFNIIFIFLYLNAIFINKYAQNTSNMKYLQEGAYSYYIFTTKRVSMRKSSRVMLCVTPGRERQVRSVTEKEHSRGVSSVYGMARL